MTFSGGALAARWTRTGAAAGPAEPAARSRSAVPWEEPGGAALWAAARTGDAAAVAAVVTAVIAAEEVDW